MDFTAELHGVASANVAEIVTPLVVLADDDCRQEASITQRTIASDIYVAEVTRGQDIARRVDAGHSEFIRQITTICHVPRYQIQTTDTGAKFIHLVRGECVSVAGHALPVGLIVVAGEPRSGADGRRGERRRLEHLSQPMAV